MHLKCKIVEIFGFICRSTDYGTSFTREDKTKFTKGSKNINGIHFCKGNNKRVNIVWKSTIAAYKYTLIRNK